MLKEFTGLPRMLARPQGSVVFGDGSVNSTLSYVIDEDDPYRGLWKILAVDRKGKLSPQVFE
jgi:hypothetical protein